MKKRNILFIGISLLSLILLFGFIQNSVSENNKWQKVETVNVKQSFTVTGTVEALNKSTITAPLTGTIETVKVLEGKRINTGEILAIYDKNTYLTQISQLQDELQGSKATLLKYKNGMRKEEIAKAKYEYEQAIDLLNEKKLILNKNETEMERYKKLFEKQLISKNDFDTFVAGYEVSKQQVLAQKNAVESALSHYELLKNGYQKEDIERAKSQADSIKSKIDEINVSLNKCIVKSPINGQITEKMIDSGRNVLTGETLFQIVNTTDLEIKATVEEENINNIELNDKVEIFPDADPNKMLIGKITSIYDQVNENTRLLPIRIRVTNNNNFKLLPGMTVSCTFKGHYLNYLVVPQKAIKREGKRYYVETQTGKIFLEVGKKHDDKVLVKGNLKAQEEIFVE